MSEMATEGQVVDTNEDPIDELDEIQNLLNGAGENLPDDESQQVDDVLNPTEEDPEPVVDKNAIDYEKEIPMPNGEHVTIGALKDLWQQQANVQLEITERENTMIANARQLEKLIEWTDAIPPEYKEQVIAFKQQELAQEHNKMLKAIPEWNDRNTYELGRQGIFNLAQEYDMVDLVSNLTDHRAIKLLNDYAKLKASLKAVTQQVKKVEKPVAKPVVKTTPGAKRTLNTDHELGAIDKLLGR
jgi:hypothetical protein